MCQKLDCPIYATCDKEADQALYCRKVELLMHLCKIGKMTKPRVNYVQLPMEALMV